MSASLSTSPGRAKQKRSGCVTLVLVGTVVSVCGLGVYACTRGAEVRDEEVEYVSRGHSYSNNHHIPGVGFFHAPFGAWFPHRYNESDPARGHYYNGQWNQSPHVSNIASSVPGSEAVSRANSQWRSADPAGFAARKSSIASHRSSFRGGFGSSSRSSGS